MTWSPAQFLAWGPAPGWSTPPIDGTKPLHELLGYRGLTVDPPGYVQQGLRPYDPQTGRWLAPDPVGHAGSLSLYDYCDNDPLNVFDPDGRLAKGALGGATLGDYYQPKNFAQGLGQVIGQVGVGLTPVGILGDIRDFTSAVGQLRNEGLNRQTGLGLAMSVGAFVPGAGDLIKGVGRAGMNALPVSSAMRAVPPFPVIGTIPHVPSAPGAPVFQEIPTNWVPTGPAARGVDDFVPNVPVGRRTKIGETGPDGIQPNGAGRHTPQHVNPPYQPVQNTPGSVNGIDYSGHAFDQMRNRGLVPSVVENALRTGTRTPGNTPGTQVFTDSVNSVKVIINSNGRVITVE
jgi:RHS repeat-associated protein